MKRRHAIAGMILTLAFTALMIFFRLLPATFRIVDKRPQERTAELY